MVEDGVKGLLNKGYEIMSELLAEGSGIADETLDMVLAKLNR